VRVADDAEALASAAASVFLACAMGVPRGGELTVALSGGSTPRRMHQILAAAPLKEVIPWNRVRILFGDERCVPPDHADSNYRMARETLLAQVPIDAGRIHRMEGELGPEEGSARYEATVRRVVEPGPSEDPSLELIFLGMGDDGHTASLFPGTPAVRESSRLVTAGYNANLKSHRITFTPRLINAAKLVVFVVSGAGKAGVLHRILEEQGPVDEHPSRAVSPSHGAVLWLVDRPAAAQLAASSRAERAE
jgi:6-phosphogluconolactonase